MNSVIQKIYFANVLVAYQLDQEFTYSFTEDQIINIGSIVLVPFRNKNYLGVVRDTSDKTNFDLKKIKLIVDVSSYSLSKKMIKFLEWIASYNLIPKGMVLKMILPKSEAYFDKENEYENNENILTPNDLKLNDTQTKAREKIEDIISHNEYSTILLDGMPGSGKTEVYFDLIEKNILDKKQSLILFPEVSLTNDFIKRIEKRFGYLPDIWHSKITPSKKKKIIHKIISGRSQILIGTRSALFLPYKNLGMLVVDEEHDPSYKQEEKGIYSARDMAVVRASIEKFTLILVSATPSLETIYNIDQSKYFHVKLKNKFSITPEPKITVIDMKKSKLKKNNWVSDELKKTILKKLSMDQQSLLFINKRGYAPMIICKSCGHKFTCKNCSSYLVEHLKDKKLLCHHCGYKLGSFQIKCQSCNNEDESFVDFGAGIEKIYNEIARDFPTAKICLFSSDHIKSSEDLNEKVEKIYNNKFDIIIGTQLITKGYHFPFLTCVGVVDADMTLRGGDLRASEKTYQMLYQVAGRAGRGDIPGEVYLQSYFPENETIKDLTNMDREKFYKKELNIRMRANLPPISKMAAIIVSGRNISDVQQACLKLSKSTPKIDNVVFYGPAPAPLSRLKGKHRLRFLIHEKKGRKIQKIILHWLSKVPQTPGVTITTDIDPQNFT
jgi:primosomal protein N' (replication factor Y)